MSWCFSGLLATRLRPAAGFRSIPRPRSARMKRSIFAQPLSNSEPPAMAILATLKVVTGRVGCLTSDAAYVQGASRSGDPLPCRAGAAAEKAFESKCCLQSLATNSALFSTWPPNPLARGASMSQRLSAMFPEVLAWRTPGWQGAAARADPRRHGEFVEISLGVAIEA